MTMNELLRSILSACDDVDSVFDHADTTGWPGGAVDALRRSRFIRRAAHGLYAPCPDCDDGHVEPVMIRDGPNGPRYFIGCQRSLRVEVQPQMCNGWEIDGAGLAATVAHALGLTGSPKAVVPDRLWKLGRTPWPPGQAATRQVVLVRRMREGDAPSIAAHVGAGGRAIVLVPSQVPDDRVWLGRVPAVIALSEVLAFEDGELVVDAAAVVDAIQASDRLADAVDAVALDNRSKTMVRRQVKAEIKSLLTDDAMVAAYKQYGSYRQAAKALTEQTGQPITKDKVKRAVDRQGGVASVVPDADSNSVGRAVASQRRDRAKKFLERR